MGNQRKCYFLIAAIFIVFIFSIIKNLKQTKSELMNSHEKQNQELLKQKNSVKKTTRWKSRNKLDYVRTRDFIRYDCENLKRIGGMSQYVANAPDPLFRIDGAWFVCFDNQLAPVNNSCNVLSLGINTDFSFDEEMNIKYGCMVHSFDPIIEAPFFKYIRETKKQFKPVVEVNDKWKFYKVGISNENSNPISQLRFGSRLDFKSIMRLTGMENQILDIFKMDIEGEEKNVFDNFDMEYACKYIKQIIFETHKNFNFQNLVKLEECFYLFYRHTRFFIGDLFNQPTGILTEFQNPTGYKLNLALFGNETNLAEFMFVNGEIYFANENFFS